MIEGSVPWSSWCGRVVCICSTYLGCFRYNVSCWHLEKLAHQSGRRSVSSRSGPSRANSQSCRRSPKADSQSRGTGTTACKDTGPVLSGYESSYIGRECRAAGPIQSMKRMGQPCNKHARQLLLKHRQPKGSGSVRESETAQSLSESDDHRTENRHLKRST